VDASFEARFVESRAPSGWAARPATSDATRLMLRDLPQDFSKYKNLTTLDSPAFEYTEKMAAQNAAILDAQRFMPDNEANAQPDLYVDHENPNDRWGAAYTATTMGPRGKRSLDPSRGIQDESMDDDGYPRSFYDPAGLVYGSEKMRAVHVRTR